MQLIFHFHTIWVVVPLDYHLGRMFKHLIAIWRPRSLLYCFLVDYNCCCLGLTYLQENGNNSAYLDKMAFETNKRIIINKS